MFCRMMTELLVDIDSVLLTEPPGDEQCMHVNLYNITVLWYIVI